MAAPPALELARQALLAKGYNQHVVAGIIGNLWVESNGDPEAIGDLNLDSRGARGLAQWRGERLDNLIAFAEKSGRKGRDPVAQIEFLDAELREMPETLKRMQDAKSPEAAAYIFAKEYERPKVVDSDRMQAAAAANRWIDRTARRGTKVRPPEILRKLDTAVEPVAGELGRGVSRAVDAGERALATIGVGEPADIATRQEAREAEWTARGGAKDSVLQQAGMSLPYLALGAAVGSPIASTAYGFMGRHPILSEVANTAIGGFPGLGAGASLLARYDPILRALLRRTKP